MTDAIAPITDVTQPMSDDMGLNMSNGKHVGLENLPKEEYNEVLKNTVEDLIKKYLHGKIELEKNA